MTRSRDTANPSLSRTDRSAGPAQHIATDILIYARGIHVDRQLQEAVRRKVGRVRQYAPNALRARVYFYKENGRRSDGQFRTAVLYEVPGNDLVAEHSAPDPLTALDMVSEKIERRLRRRKTALMANRVRQVRRHRASRTSA